MPRCQNKSQQGIESVASYQTFENGPKMLGSRSMVVFMILCHMFLASNGVKEDFKNDLIDGIFEEDYEDEEEEITMPEQSSSR